MNKDNAINIMKNSYIRKVDYHNFFTLYRNE